jgi:hypothetical protein
VIKVALGQIGLVRVQNKDFVLIAWKVSRKFGPIDICYPSYLGGAYNILT